MSQSKNNNNLIPVHDQKLPKKVKCFAIVAALGGFLFGFDASVINGANAGFQKTFNLDANQLGQASAIALLGCAAGAFFSGEFSNKFGRVRTMLVASFMFFISALGCGFSNSEMMMLIWRVIGGVGIGIASVIAPGYISEIAPAKFRGRLASLQQMAIVLGIFFTLFSNAVLANIASGAAGKIMGFEAWRWMFILGIFPAIIYGILAFKLPESPRYLMLQNNEFGARETLNHINENDIKETERQIKLIKKSIKNESSAKKLGYTAILRKKVVWIGIVLAALQQFVGINVIFYYSTILWKSVGFGESMSFWISLLNSTINVIATIWAIKQVDKLGRRICFIVGAIGMTFTLSIMSIIFQISPIIDGSPQLQGVWGPIALIAANCFVISFAISWGPVVWVMLGEMFETRIRAIALGISGVSNWIANYIVSVSFPILAAKSLGLTYGIYAIFAFFAGIFVFFFIPETKGKELEEIDFSNPRANK